MRFFLFIKKPFLKIKGFILTNQFIFKKVVSVVFLLTLIVFLFFSPKFIFSKNNILQNLSLSYSNNNDDKQILTLWHVETFEGGSASRAKYLEDVAIKFNKQNKNFFITIKVISENQLYLNLSQNNYADIYSFGVGSGYMLTGILDKLDENESIRGDIQRSSMLNNNILAYPYILSAYVDITKQNDIISTQKNKKQKIYSVSAGLKGFINPLQNLVECNYKKELKEDCFFNATSYDAYCNFVNGKSQTLIGTLRDYARVKNREKLGTISSCNYNILCSYTDLIQCIGVNKNISNIKRQIAKSFCNFITQFDSQRLISGYGMFSVGANKIYQEEEMSNFENTLLKSNLKVSNVFDSIENIEKTKNENLIEFLL